MNELRWSNIQKARVSYERGDRETAPGPIEAFFEIAARCNLRCQMCAINYDSRYKNSSGRPAFFSPELFERLSSAFPTLMRAYLFGLGEPLLNPHMMEYIERLSRSGVEVWFNTNGTLIDEEMGERIAVAGADRVTVSIDGATARTFETIRRGARWADVIRGIESLVKAGEKYGRPKVNFSFVAMRSNIGELPALVELSAVLGTTGVHVEPLYSQEHDALEEHYRRENLGTLPPDHVMAIMNEASLRAATLGVSVASRFLSEACGSFDYVERAPGLGIHWTCTEPWSSIWVTAAGEVRTCCINETSFGSLSENTFAEIWNGEAFRSFRADHASRTRMPEGCGNCIRNGRPRQSPFFRTIETVTYRPLELPRSGTARPVRIDWPPEGETVTDPLVVVGRVEDADARRWEVVIDGCALPAVEPTADGRFVAFGDVPFLTEGAHVLWIRDPDDPASGWDHREVHFWRPEVAEPEAMRAASVVAVPLSRPCSDARLFLDGRIQPHVLVADSLDRPSVLVMDARDIPAGAHGVEVWSGRAKVGALRIERMRTANGAPRAGDLSGEAALSSSPSSPFAASSPAF